MTASQSNLSDPRYGFDLVVAVSQASINVTLKEFLLGLSAPEITICYVYDENDNFARVDYQTLLVNAQGSDPFKVADKADPATDKDLVNLANANFAGAVRATLGLPGVPPANLPPIATLGHGASAPVLFNLLCAQFQVAGFRYGQRARATWINAAQPSDGTPWYFSATVELNRSAVDPDAKVPPAVQRRISELQHQVQNAFSIQKLFLDLDTAILEAVPAIVNVPDTWPVWNLITSVFLESYFAELRKAGDPVLSYSFTLDSPRPTTLELGSVSRECCPLLDADGKQPEDPTPAQRNAATLVYVGTQSATPPVPVPFAWNWLELADVNAFSGVEAVRRDVFLTYFSRLINPSAAPLCMAPFLNITSSGETFTINYGAGRSGAPQVFRPVLPVGAPAADGFTDVLTLAFTSTTHGDATSGSRFWRLWGDFNYYLSGTVAIKGNQIRIQVRATAYMSFEHSELGIEYTDLAGANYYDKTLTVLYTLGVDQNGALQVTHAINVADNSATWNFAPKGLLGTFGYEDDVKKGLTEIEEYLGSHLDSAFTGYVNSMTGTINGYNAWVFAGNDAFTFKKVAFSQGLDLITELTYVNPS
jgi:hypothetical protein